MGQNRRQAPESTHAPPVVSIRSDPGTASRSFAVKPLHGEAGIAHQLLTAAGIAINLGTDTDKLAGKGRHYPEQQDDHHQLDQGKATVTPRFVVGSIGHQA